MRQELFLARRYTFRGRAKHISFISIVSCLGVGVGVAALIVVISVMNGFDRDLMERLLRFNYHLLIEGSPEELFKLKEEIKDYPQLKSASLFLQTQVFVNFDDYVVPLLLKGMDLSNREEQKNFFPYVTEVRDKEGFFVGEGIKRRFFVVDKLEFYTLKDLFSLRSEKVRGTFKVGIYDIDSNYLVTDLDKFREITSRYLTFLGLRLDNPFWAERFKEGLRKKYPTLLMSTWAESNRVLFSALKLEKITMFIILSLIILVASFNIFATLTVKVVEKTKDIGILKSIGYSDKNILTIFSLQGLLLGLVGVGLGGGIGIGLCFILKRYPFIRLPEEIYYIEYLPVALNARDIFLILVVGVALSFISSLFPARRAGKLPPVEALRYE